MSLRVLNRLRAVATSKVNLDLANTASLSSASSYSASALLPLASLSPIAPSVEGTWESLRSISSSASPLSPAPSSASSLLLPPSASDTLRASLRPRVGAGAGFATGSWPTATAPAKLAFSSNAWSNGASAAVVGAGNAVPAAAAAAGGGAGSAAQVPEMTRLPGMSTGLGGGDNLSPSSGYSAVLSPMSLGSLGRYDVPSYVGQGNVFRSQVREYSRREVTPTDLSLMIQEGQRMTERGLLKNAAFLCRGEWLAGWLGRSRGPWSLAAV